MENLVCEKTLTIDTRDIALMTDTSHGDILRKLEGACNADGTVKQVGIIPTLEKGKFPVNEYFIKSSYKDASGKENTCYRCTKLGCDFIANKFTGEKGILFTAAYVKRFHDMEDAIKSGVSPVNSLQADNITVLNETAKILLPLYDELGMRPQFKFLAAKNLYSKAGLELPSGDLTVERQYFDLDAIASKVGLYSSKGNPHGQAVGAILKKLDIAEDEKNVVAFDTGSHAGTTIQYAQSVIDKVQSWLVENNYPTVIGYKTSKGMEKKYTVIYGQNVA